MQKEPLLKMWHSSIFSKGSLYKYKTEKDHYK